MEKDWDSDKQRVKKSHSNSARLNNLILKKLSEVSEKSLELEQNSPAVSSKTIQKALKLTGGTTFFKQAEIYCAELKRAGKFNRLSADQPRINRFKEFLNHADIAFQDITPDLLKRFKTYLMSTRTIKERTAINHLIVIRSVFSQAISAGLVDTKYYPFGRDKIVVKFPDNIKIGLTAEEIKAIEELDLMSEPKMDHARNLFLLSFYFAGMRISDVLRLKWSDFQDGRLHYVMGKNLKGGSVMPFSGHRLKGLCRLKGRQSLVFLLLGRWVVSKRNRFLLAIPLLTGLNQTKFGVMPQRESFVFCIDAILQSPDTFARGQDLQIKAVGVIEAVWF